MNYTKGEWKVGNNTGITGPTTPALPFPVTGGEDWPYQIVTVGMDTIAIVPAQPRDHIVGQVSKPLKDNDKANAHLIAAAPDMYEALTMAEDFMKGLGKEFPHFSDNPKTIRFNTIIRQALTKAEGLD